MLLSCGVIEETRERQDSSLDAVYPLLRALVDASDDKERPLIADAAELPDIVGQIVAADVQLPAEAVTLRHRSPPSPATSADSYPRALSVSYPPPLCN